MKRENKRDAKLRMEGYDFARHRCYKLAMLHAKNASKQTIARALEILAEQIGVFLADYTGRQVPEEERGATK